MLNKADSISEQQLMRVYGALMWSLGKVINTPEVLRVYIGSFWDKPVDPEHQCRKLFESEHADLLSDLRSLPRNSAIRKINELVKRARLAKVHAYIISHLKSEMPSMFGKAKKQAKLLENLGDEFAKISQRQRIPPGDFPNLNRFRSVLKEFELSKFPKLNEKSMAKIDSVLSQEIPVLMKQMRHPSVMSDDEEAALNPFADATGEPDDLVSSGWCITQYEKTKFDNVFHSAKLVDGKLQGSSAKDIFASSGLPNSMLFKVWKAADIDGDGALDSDEFAVAMYLVQNIKNGGSIPDVLPPDLIPPSKR